VTNVEEGLNIVKEALEIGKEYHEYSGYSFSECEKVHNKHKLCEDLLLQNNKRIRDVQNQLRVLQEKLHKKNHWSSSTGVPKDTTRSRPRRSPCPHSSGGSPHPIDMLKMYTTLCSLVRMDRNR